MEHQDPGPLANQLFLLDVDADADDEEYKVESDGEADDSESDEGDEQEALLQEEDTLHLPDIADDLLGSLEEDVLSDSECVESDVEDEDKDGCAGTAAANLQQQWQRRQAREGMHEEVAGGVVPQERPARGSRACDVWNVGVHGVDQQSAEFSNDGSVSAAQHNKPLMQRCPATLRELSQEQLIPYGLNVCSSKWDVLGSLVEPRPVQGHQHAIYDGGAPGVPTATKVLLAGRGCGTVDGGLLAKQQQQHFESQGQATDREQKDGVLGPPSGGICRRTRAHVSLRDVDLSDLEQQLPEHIDLEEIELAEDDEEYGKFLQSLFDDTTALPEDSSDEDPDFAADLYLETSKDDDRDWLKILNSPEREDGGSAAGVRGPAVDSPARRTRARLRRPKGFSGTAGTGAEESGGSLEMTGEQLSMLYAQVHCHAQLLLQTYAMFAGDSDSETQELVAQAKGMLYQLALCRDVQSATRKLLGVAPYTAEDLLRPPANAVALPHSAGSAPVASTGTADWGNTAAATTSSDGSGFGRVQIKARGFIQSQQAQALMQASKAAAAARGGVAATTSALGCSEISQDEISTAGNEYDCDLLMGGTAAGVQAAKAAAAARSASLTAAIVGFRPAWCPGPEGCIWSVLDVVPLRKFPEVEAVLHTLPSMPDSAMRLLRDLQAVTKSKRKNRRRRQDDPLMTTWEWAQPALQCLQDYLVPALLYKPSPPVPRSYWTIAEDELMMYGISRYGTDWRLIAGTLLVTRSSSQIYNRYKNLNARRRTPEEDVDDGRADDQLAQPGAGLGGPAAGVRKSKTVPMTRMKGPAVGVGSAGGIRQTTGSALLPTSNTLQTTAVAGFAGFGANPGAAATVSAAAALLAPPMAPELASMVHAARIVGLPPAVAAAHIIKAQKQLWPNLQPQPHAANPQVPLPLALQLLQLAKSASTNQQAAAVVQLLAAHLRDPSTAPMAISAAERGVHEVMPQLTSHSTIVVKSTLASAAGAAVTANVGTSTAADPPAVREQGLGGLPNNGGSLCQRGGFGSGGGNSLLAMGAPSVLELATQLLQASLATNLNASLSHQVPLTSQLLLQAGAAGGASMVPPLAQSTAAAQYLSSFLSQRKSMGSLASSSGAPTQMLLPSGHAAGAVVQALAASTAPQPVRALVPGLPAEKVLGDDPGSSLQEQRLPIESEAPLSVAEEHKGGKPTGAPPIGQEHDHGQGEPMHWTRQPLASPETQYGSGSDCGLGLHNAGTYGATQAAAPPLRSAAAGTDLLAGATAPAVVSWKPPQGGLPGDVSAGAVLATRPVAGVPPMMGAGPGTTSNAAAYEGPTDPRLSHNKDLPVHHPEEAVQLLASQQQQRERGEVSPSALVLQHALHQQGHQQQELPSLSDNFTIGGISDLLSHGLLKSGAATPATCVSPQGGVASTCTSHGHTMSLLLGSSLGMPTLSQNEADGDSSTPTEKTATGLLGAGRDGNVLSNTDRGHCTHSIGRQAPCAMPEEKVKTTGNADPDRIGADAEGIVRTPGRYHPFGAPSRLPNPCSPQSPASPTSARVAPCCRVPMEEAMVPLPQRLALLRGGLEMTPSSDPKTRWRSRIGGAIVAEDRDAVRNLAPSPFEGTAQNSHREGCGARNDAEAGSYRPRPPLFADKADGVGSQDVPEGFAAVEDDDGDTAQDGLARARKRLRLDTEDKMVGGAAQAPLRSYGPRDGTAATVITEMHGLGSAANSVATSPVDLTSLAKRAAAATAAGTAAGLLSATHTPTGLHVEPHQQSHHSADTDSTGSCKRRTEPTIMTSGASAKRVRHGETNGGMGSNDADPALVSAGSERWEALIEAVAAPATVAITAATAVEVGGGRDGNRHQSLGAGPGTKPSRFSGQKRSRSVAGQKPAAIDKDKASGAAASVLHIGPLGVVDANVNAGATEAVVACSCVAPDSLCAIAGVSAVPAKVCVKRQTSSCAVATAVAKTSNEAATGGTLHDDERGMLQAVVVGKPPKAPIRRAGAGANRLTRASAITAAEVASGSCPAPSTRQRQTSGPSNTNGKGRTVPSATPPSIILREEACQLAVPATSPPSHYLPMLSTPGSAVMSEISSGALSLHSLLCASDTLDIISMLPSMSTRSMGVTGNVCSPTSSPCAIAAAPITIAVATATAPEAGSSDPVDPLAVTNASHRSDRGGVSSPTAQPLGFASPPHSQLLQLTPFASSVFTLGSLDMLPLFSNSTDLWNALQVGSACGTTSRGPEARIVASSTTAGDGNGEGPHEPPQTLPDIPPLDPWSRFMATCSPTSHSHGEAAPLPSFRSDHSFSAFRTFIANVVGPQSTSPHATAATAAMRGRMPFTEQPVAKDQLVSNRDQEQVANEVGAAVTSAAFMAVASSSQVLNDLSPSALPRAAAAADIAGDGDSVKEPSMTQDANVLRKAPSAMLISGTGGTEGLGAGLQAVEPEAELPAPSVVPEQRPLDEEDGVRAARGQDSDQGALEVAGEMRPCEAGLKIPRPSSVQMVNLDALTTGLSKPAPGAPGTAPGALLPPLPPPFPRHGPTPSPIAQAQLDSRPPPSETVRLFGRTVVKPLPIASPTMPAPSKLLHSVAPPATSSETAGCAVTRPMQLPAQECDMARISIQPDYDTAVGAAADGVDDNSNSRSRSQPENAGAPQPGAVLLEPSPPLPAVETPAHGSAGGRDSLRRIFSPLEIPLGATLRNFSTLLIGTSAAAAAAAPTPVQTLRVPSIVAPVAAAAWGQQTPGAVAPAGGFAIPDTLATVAVAAPLSLTPLPALNATAAKTVGRREPRRSHEPLGTHGPSISHWGSNDHDPGQEPAVPCTELERQGSGGWRNSGVLHWRGVRTTHMAVCAGGYAVADTPGHVTCFSKVAQCGLGAVDPLVMPSPSVLQPTPRARQARCDDGEEVVPLHAGRSSPKTHDFDDLEGAGESRENSEGVTAKGDEGGDNDRSAGAEKELLEEAARGMDSPGHMSVAAVSPAATAAAMVGDNGSATDVVGGTGAATAPVMQVDRSMQEAHQALPQVSTMTAAEAVAGPVWAKEQDQLAMREIFRLGEGPSTWRSISEQLGGGAYSVTVVEARGKLLMARMMQLM